MTQYLKYDVQEQAAIITINRPEVRNAMSTDCWEELDLLMDRALADDEIRAIIITGAGEKVFVSGADINGLRVKNGITHLDTVSKAVLEKIENCSKPVVAAINGIAFGGGFEVALACDIRIAATNAKFGLPETNLGIMPGCGGTQRLSRIAGIGLAKEIILAGRVLTAHEAANAGIVMKVSEPGQLLDDALSIVKTFAKKGPISLNLAKRMINASLDTDRATGLLLENLGFAVLLDSEDKLEGTSAFLEKRDAKFTNK